ncbi:voltage-dependent calcium channel subunit alpha-2 delta-2-like [Brachionus plicatilis]|uniref:Voltage-dependent calcium channel subunit alpha-2 delta-2-like n=1 Tax=Brachionus plicatilis TaxID=10195 RepID=A0A3M7PX60_BRAPC|nr:voltage-dependent calcium channel subunit alpha-2 delta-2-like [Brachionus plicatilis]
MKNKKFPALLLFLLHNLNAQYSYIDSPVEDDLTASQNPEYGRLTGDVQNWATIIQNYILQSASDLINKDLTQELFDLANYTVEAKNGEDVVKEVKDTLSNYFSYKQQAAMKIANKAVELYDLYFSSENQIWKNYSGVHELKTDFYRDSDVPNLLPTNMQFSTYFKQKVSFQDSIVKISDEIPRNDAKTIKTVMYTKGLDEYRSYAPVPGSGMGHEFRRLLQ